MNPQEQRYREECRNLIKAKIDVREFEESYDEYWKNEFEFYLAGRKAGKEEIESLKKTLVNTCATLLEKQEEIQKLKDLVNRAKKFESHAHWCKWEDEDECNCGFDQWLKEAEEVLK